MIIRIGNNFPVAITLLPEAKLNFIPLQEIMNGAVVDQCDYQQFPDGVSAIWDKDGFHLQKGIDSDGNIDYNHAYQYHAGYPYKGMPILKEWLLQQRLVAPN